MDKDSIFANETSHPILLIGNTRGKKCLIHYTLRLIGLQTLSHLFGSQYILLVYSEKRVDFYTSAHKMSKAFGGSAVLTQNSLGVGAIYGTKLKYKRAYIIFFSSIVRFPLRRSALRNTSVNISLMELFLRRVQYAKLKAQSLETTRPSTFRVYLRRIGYCIQLRRV